MRIIDFGELIPKLKSTSDSTLFTKIDFQSRTSQHEFIHDKDLTTREGYSLMCDKCRLLWVMEEGEIEGHSNSRIRSPSNNIDNWNIDFAKCSISDEEYKFRKLLK